MQREAHHQEGAQGERAGRVGRSDRHAFAEVVQPDPDRDEECERPPDAPERRPASHSDTPVSARNATTAPSSTTAAPPKACEPSPASSNPSSVASMARNASSPTVNAITARSHARRDAADPRQPEHPQCDRDHAHVHAEQRHQAEEREVCCRGLDCHRDLVRDRPPGRGEQHDLVRLALDPRLRDAHRRRLQPPHRGLAAGELRERVVDDRLRDRHGVRSVVAHRELDRPRLEHRALDHQLLRRRPAPLPEPGPVQQREGRDRSQDQ